MNEELPIDLNEAKQSFVRLMRSLNKTDQQKFLAFIMEEWKLKSTTDYNNIGLLYFDIYTNLLCFFIK